MRFLHALRAYIFLACIIGLFLAGCGESDGPAEKAGKSIDQAVEGTTDSVTDAMESTGDAIKDAADSTGEAINDAGDAASEAVGLKD